MKRKIGSAITLALLLTSVLTLAFNIQPVKASGTVGVKAGDWIKCTYTISGWPSGTPYPEWLKVEFLSVEGTNVTVRVTMRMSDGTEQSDTMTVDVAAGGGTFQGLSGFVIPANCTIGDSIYITGYGNVTIAGETTRTYAGASRTVVYASFSQYGTQLTYYWDKQTGVMVEASVTSGDMTATAKATETNMWQAEAIYIRADGSIDPPTVPISTVDNVTYTLTGNITSDVDGIVVERSNITIDGNGQTLEGNGDTSSIGILLSGLDNVTVRNISISGFGIGVSIYTMASNNIVSGNNITNSARAGIYVSFNPKILANPNWFLYTPKYNNISANYLANNNRSIYFWRTSDNTIYGNNILNSNISGICLEDASNTTIARNNVTNSHDGIFFWGVPYNNTVYGNTIVNGTRGLCCGSVNSVLRNNTMVNNRYNFVSGGIVNDVDTSNTVDGKPIYYWVNEQDMIVPLDAGHVTLVNCTGITARNLNLTNNSPGILLWSTKNSAVTLCNITNNYGGILLQDSLSSSIVGNNIENNEYAGIELEGSSGNSLFHNNIINNINGTVTVASWGNTWDNGYPSGGNYWSNHASIDLYAGLYQNTTGSDGIGDTPYSIDANNQDNYPLTAMFSDFNTTSEYRVQTICNSSISGFKSNGTSISFNVAGEDGTAGFCRICIPTALMNATYRVFVNGTEVQCNLLSCSNSTHNYLYFTYGHSTKEIVIIPELASLIILPLFMIATLLTIIVSRRKRFKHPKGPPQKKNTSSTSFWHRTNT